MPAKSPVTFRIKSGPDRGRIVSFMRKKRRSPAKSLAALNARLMKAFPSKKQAKMRSNAVKKWKKYRSPKR